LPGRDRTRQAGLKEPPVGQPGKGVERQTVRLLTVTNYDNR
jgi:hypothetical protein